MFRRLLGKIELEVSMTAIGDLAGKVGERLINQLKPFDVKIHSLLIASNKSDKSQEKAFNRVFIYPLPYEKTLASRRKLLSEIQVEQASSLEKDLQKTVKNDSRFHFFIISSDGFSTAFASRILETLSQQYGITPIIFYILPDLNAPSNELLNTSEFMYEMFYKPHPLRLPVILIDLKPASDEQSMTASEFFSKKQDELSIAVRDLVVSSFLPPQVEDFNATIDDLSEVLRLKGLSMLVSKELGEINEAQKAIRVNDLIVDSVAKSMMLRREDVYRSKQAYIAWFNVELDFQTNFEAKKLVTSFETIRPHLKFVKNEELGIRAVRAVIAGLPTPPRIIRTMQLARDLRKTIMTREGSLYDTYPNFDFDLIQEEIQSFENLVFEARSSAKRFSL